MSLRLGDTAPDFTIATSQGDITLSEWAGDSWVFFFSHPADFTPVCTTEMGKTAELAPEFEARNVKPLGLSTDSAQEHLEWIKDIDDTQGVSLKFPIVADKDSTVAQQYGMIHPGESQTATVRTVFILDPQLKVRMTLTYPMSVGRNFDEILRVIDALQNNDKHGVATPANWRPGDKVIIPPSTDNEAAKKAFPQGWDEVRPYLRYTQV